jgi:flagellin
MRIQHNIAALNANRMLGMLTISPSAKTLRNCLPVTRSTVRATTLQALRFPKKCAARFAALIRRPTTRTTVFSLVQTAEGALNETASILQRMKELATQASNGTYQNAVDRENISKEVASLKSEIDRISTSTNFNKINLLNGNLGA